MKGEGENEGGEGKVKPKHLPGPAGVRKNCPSHVHVTAVYDLFFFTLPVQ